MDKTSASKHKQETKYEWKRKYLGIKRIKHDPTILKSFLIHSIIFAIFWTFLVLHILAVEISQPDLPLWSQIKATFNSLMTNPFIIPDLTRLSLGKLIIAIVTYCLVLFLHILHVWIDFTSVCYCSYMHMCGAERRDPTIDMGKTGENIRKILEEKNISVKELAKRLGFASPYPIYKWMAGKSIPSIDHLVILTDVFNMPIEEILVIHRPIASFLPTTSSVSTKPSME